jgi:hypothetical protein
MSHRARNQPIKETAINWRKTAKQILNVLHKEEAKHPKHYVQVDKKTWKSVK